MEAEKKMEMCEKCTRRERKRCEQKKEEKEEKGDYYRNEISTSSFARSVTVPTNVEASKTIANLRDGVLEIKLPKTNTSKKQNIAVMQVKANKVPS